LYCMPCRTVRFIWYPQQTIKQTFETNTQSLQQILAQRIPLIDNSLAERVIVIKVEGEGKRLRKREREREREREAETETD
jgi:hypothetical protein